MPMACGIGSDRVERAAWGQLVEESFTDVKEK